MNEKIKTELNLRIDAYLEAREAYTEAKRLSDELESEKKKRHRQLADFMTDTGTKIHKRINGPHLSLYSQFTFSVTQETEQEVRDWLLETRGDDEPYLHKKVNKTAVKELLVQLVENEKIPPNELPPFLKLETRPGVRLSNTK